MGTAPRRQWSPGMRNPQLKRQIHGVMPRVGALSPIAMVPVLLACTREAHNNFSRAAQNRTGPNGVLDENLNMHQDPGRKKVYFEFRNFSMPWIFLEHPLRQAG